MAVQTYNSSAKCMMVFQIVISALHEDSLIKCAVEPYYKTMEKILLAGSNKILMFLRLHLDFAIFK